MYFGFWNQYLRSKKQGGMLRVLHFFHMRFIWEFSLPMVIAYHKSLIVLLKYWCRRIQKFYAAEKINKRAQLFWHTSCCLNFRLHCKAQPDESLLNFQGTWQMQWMCWELSQAVQRSCFSWAMLWAIHVFWITGQSSQINKLSYIWLSIQSITENFW